jgi:hypothetical protein
MNDVVCATEEMIVARRRTNPVGTVETPQNPHLRAIFGFARTATGDNAREAAGGVRRMDVSCFAEK